MAKCQRYGILRMQWPTFVQLELWEAKKLNKKTLHEQQLKKISCVQKKVYVS